MTRRVREPTGNVTHGPHPAGAPGPGALGGVDGEGFVAERGDRQAVLVLGRDADREVQRPPTQQVEDLVGGCDRESELDIGSLPPEGTQRLGEVVDGGHVDHPDPERAGPTGAAALHPPGQRLGVGEDPLGVADDLAGLFGQDPTPARRLEEGDPHPPLELGQALGQGRRGHPDRGRGAGEGRFAGGGDEVLELLHGQVRQDRIVHASSRILQYSFIGVTNRP